MRLLLDQNLSWRLVARWEDSFPGSAHVRDFGMTAAGDEELWAFAREHDFVIVSKDGDFDDERVFRGPPPKVIHLVVGNASSSDGDDVVRARLGAIKRFETDDHRLLILE